MRHRISLAAVAALVLAACSDDPGRTPTGVGAASDLSAVTAVCEPATIRYTLANLLTDAGAKAYAIPHFNAGQQADAAGDVVLAEQEYFRVINHVIDRYVRGGTAQPKRYDSVQSAVYWVVLALYDCADAELPIAPGALAELIDDIGSGGTTGDIGIGVVGPGVDFDIVVASKQFSFSGDGDFWDEPGIVVLRRIYDDEEFSDGVYNEYPPRYNITVTPYTAQANFDDVAPIGNGPEDVQPVGSPNVTALVTICPGTGHPEPGTNLFILRRPEAFLDAPLEELPTATPDPDVLCDATLPAYAAPEVIGQAPVGPGVGAMRGLLASVWRHLGPAPLHAVDGGIGGRVRLASDYVSADQDPVPLYVFTQEVVEVSTFLPPWIVTQDNALTLFVGDDYRLAVSTSDAELAPLNAICVWSNIGPSSPVTINENLIAAASLGTTTLRATCGSQTVDLTVTVTQVT